MNLFVVIFVLIFNKVIGDPIFKDYVYSRELNAFYKLYEQKLSFTDASIFCAKEDANLLVPTSNFEINFIMEYGQRINAATLLDYYWIGVNNFADINRYLPTDNSDSKKVILNWVQNNPHKNMSEYGGLIFLKLGLMYPYHYTTQWRFICKKSWGNPNFTEIEKPKFRSDYYYNFKLKAFYKYYKTPPLKFSDAAFKCMEDGAKLYIPQSEDELEFVSVYFTSPLTMIGVHDIDKDRKYEAIDGSDITKAYKRFHGNREEGKDCLEVDRFGTAQYINCDEKRLTVCKISLNDIKRDDICKTYIPGYQYDSETGRCYKYYSNHEDWHSARKNCEANNATLFFINYERKVEFIRNLVQKEVPSYEVALHSGFEKQIFGKFRSLNGLWLKDIQYNKWTSNNPDEYKSLHCGAITRNFQMTYRDCADNLPYICEMSTSD